MKIPDSFGRWPLLLVGLLVLSAAVGLSDPNDREGIRALLLGIGAMLTGAGTVHVSWGHRDPTYRDPRSRTRADDAPGPTDDRRA